MFQRCCPAQSNQSTRNRQLPGDCGINQRCLADQNEGNKNQKILDAYQQSGIVPNPPRRQENGCEHEQQLVNLQGSEIEKQVGSLMVEQGRLKRDAITSKQQQGDAQQIEWVANQQSPKPTSNPAL